MGHLILLGSDMKEITMVEIRNKVYWLGNILKSDNLEDQEGNR